MHRRTFIETSVATAIMTSTANALWASPPAHEIKKVGVQLYTVRHLMKDDFDGTIAGIAKIGFKEVEFAGYFGKTPQEVQATLVKNGLTSPSAHHGMDDHQRFGFSHRHDRHEGHRDVRASRRERTDHRHVHAR